MKAVKYCMHFPQVTWLISKIKIDVIISGDMYLYQGTFDLLIERCLHIRDFPVLLIIILLNSLQLRLVQVGTLLYIANHLSYKCCNDLNIYKKNELESTFIEIVNPKKSNIIVGVIYRHPSMDLTDFNCNYLNKLLENISK